jgi:hypothetical protein
MPTNDDKPKRTDDFKKLAAPILQRLAQEASGKNPRKAAHAKETYDLVQAVITFSYAREQSGDAKRAENLRLKGQIEALKGIVGDRVIVAHPEKREIQSEGDGGEGDDH